MSPGLYAYPDDPRPAVREVAARYKERFGIDINYLGEACYAGAVCVIEALQRAGRDLNGDLVPAQYGADPGLAGYARRAAADHYGDGSPCLDTVVPVGGEADSMDAGGE